MKDNFFLVFGTPIVAMLSLGLAALYHINIEFMIYMWLFMGIIYGLSIVHQYRKYVRTVRLEESEVTQSVDEEGEKKWQNMKDMEDFFALWTHQIKTPIAALNLLLQDDEPDTVICRNEVFKIEGYVEMALGYIRFDEMNNDLSLNRYNLETLARQIVKKYAPIFIHKHIAVKLENLDQDILTDEKWFGFVLEQILSNALKYTQTGSITIRAVEDQRDGRMDIEIEDTGIGIRSEDIPRLFEKGFTGYNGRMDKKASGLGLYLCKGVCRKLGHSIRIESRGNIGTKVILGVHAENVKREDLERE